MKVPPQSIQLHLELKPIVCSLVIHKRSHVMQELMIRLARF